MKKIGSLHKRMVMGLLVLTFFTILLIFAGSSFVSKEVVKDISKRNLNIAELVGTQSFYILKRPAHNLEKLSQRLNGISNPAKLQQIILELSRYCNLLQMIQILDEDGHVVAVVPQDKDQIGLDLSRQPFFIEAKNGEGLQWTDSLYSAQTQSPIITISIRFLGGVLVGHINLQILSELTRVSLPDANKFIAIVDKKGIVIAHSDPQQSLKGINILNMEAVKKGLAGKAGTYRENYNSVPGLISVTPIKGAGWAALVFQPEKQALASIHALRFYAITGTILIAIAGFAVIIFFRKTLLKPIETLTERTEAISLGEYDVRIDPEYEEFQAVASSFNNMAEAIDDREQQIFYESQVNKAQAEIVRIITETDSPENLCKVVHKWALDLTTSSYGIVKIIDIKKDAANKNSAMKEPEYICYFHDDNSFNFPSEIGSHGELWDKAFKNNTVFLTNDASKMVEMSALPADHFPLNRVMSVPVIYQGENLGRIVVANGINEYHDRDLKTLKVLSDLLAVAINRIRADQILISNERKMRKLRNYLSNIINSMPSMLIGVEPDGRITQWNRKAEQNTGMALEQVLGQPLQTVIPRLAKEMEQVRKAINTRQEQVDSKRSRHEEGMTKYEDLTIYPLITNGIEGAVIRIDDVTSRVNLEQMMVQSEKMMSVGGLAAGMAHEINNPLAAILGQTRNMQRRLIEKLPKNISVAEECGISLDAIHEYMEKRDITRMIESISDSGNRAATIVSNMLSFSRKSEKRLGSHSMPALMDKTIELASNDYDLKKEYDFRKIEIIKKYSPNLTEVLCEGSEIQQVFLNLLKNGAEAMSDKAYQHGAPQFTIHIYQHELFAVIEIEDNGPGVDENALLRMFEPFYTTKEVGKGTGLGLSVSYFIITDQHCGSMKVESAPGEWTKFTIKLPIRGLR